MGLFTKDPQVKAQELANETNLQLAEEANKTQLEIARITNDLNYQMFAEQNLWNLERRDEEWKYNDPSAQMERYLRAGINPLWAMSNGDPGKANPLTSATPSPAVAPTQVTPQVQPAFNPNKSGNIITAANNVVNSAQGFYKLALENEDVQTRRSAAGAQIAQSRAQTQLLKAQTTSSEFQNRVNSETYGYVVGTVQKQYDALVKSIDSMDANTELTRAKIDESKAMKDQLIAGTTKIQSETFSKLDNFRMRWFELQSNRITANASQQNAAINAQQLELNRKNYQLAFQDAMQRWKNADNKTILDWIDKTKGKADWLLGYNTKDSDISAFGFNAFSVEGKHPVADAMAIGIRVFDNYYKDPSQANFDVVNEYQSFVNSLQLPEPDPVQFATPSNTTVINPTSDWQK